MVTSPKTSELTPHLMSPLFSGKTWVNRYTHAHPFNSPLFGITQVSRYQKGKTNLDFTEARDSDWQWHQLGHEVCTSLQTDNHASTLPLSFLQAGCSSCRQTNSVKALKIYLSKAHTHTHPFNGPLSRTTWVSHYQQGKNQSGFYWSKRQ